MDRKSMFLNLGCGEDSYGDVRVDVRKTQYVTVVADASNLPFKDGSFENTRLFHVLEHLGDPQTTLNECMRVSKHVHAKFPGKYDCIPYLLSALTEFNLKGFYAQSRGVALRTLILLHLRKLTPQNHRWTIQPFGSWKVNRFYLPNFFVSGRKARYTRKLAIPIDAEYECRL